MKFGDKKKKNNRKYIAKMVSIAKSLKYIIAKTKKDPGRVLIHRLHRVMCNS
jgi:hypothetical protein